jgi:hypothetical protein
MVRTIGDVSALNFSSLKSAYSLPLTGGRSQRQEYRTTVRSGGVDRASSSITVNKPK